MIERKNERTIIGLSIEMSAITAQVEAAENRAKSRCPEYNASNIMWKKVDYLLEEQERVMLKIKQFNTTPITNDSTSVSEFLNLSSPDNSPTRKRKAEVSNVSECAIEDDTILRLKL